jgi:hypothetical protein
VTCHPAERKVVLSHWRDEVCVASTPLQIEDVPALIQLLVDALGNAVAAPAARPVRRSWWSTLWRRRQPSLARVIDLADRVRRPPHRRTGTGETSSATPPSA